MWRERRERKEMKGEKIKRTRRESRRNIKEEELRVQYADFPQRDNFLKLI